MSERPILFSGPMVRAILAGEKSQTRRVVKPQPNTDAPGVYGDRYNKSERWGWWLPDGRMVRPETFACPYDADTLWVRETWYSSSDGRELLGYAAYGDHPHGVVYMKRPSIFMPRAYCRINLRVTDVRVERLTDISESDAKAEGCGGDDEDDPTTPARHYPCVACSGHAHGIPDLCHPLGRGKPWRCVYANLWDAINGKRHPWASNPFVWVVSFEVVK